MLRRQRILANTNSGGKLVMFEITRPDIIRAGFVFGLLRGWWLSKS